MKNSMSWLDIKVWINEQREKMLGAYIDNVYLIDKLVILKLRNPRFPENLWLVLEPGKRINFTSMEIRGEATPRQQVWRSLLRDCIIENVHQLDLERIVFIEIRCGGVKRTLVIELLPRGIIAVLDADKRILLTTESRTMRDRVVRPGVTYTPPPMKRSVLELSENELLELLKQGRDLVRGLIRGWGLPPELAESIPSLCQLDLNTPIDKLDIEKVRCLKDKLTETIADILSNPTPCIIYQDSHPIGFYPFIPFKYRNSTRCKLFSSFNEAIDHYFREQIESSMIKKVTESILSEVNRLEKSVKDIDERVAKLDKEREKLLSILKIIEEKYLEVEEVHRCIREKIRQLGWEYINQCSEHITKVDPKHGRYTLAIDGVELDLDVREELVSIYGELRKMLSDIENSIARALEEKKRLLDRIARLREQMDLEEKRIRMQLTKRKEWYEKFHWMITSTGFLVLGGRDASQNIALLKKYAEPSDIVMHADIHGASTIVIKTQGRSVDEATLREAATLAACYSKAWKAGLRAIDVFWVKREQVSFSPPSGEYLPKGSFMVYGKKNYVRNVELQLAIGIELVDDSYRVIIGPEHIVASKAKVYMVIVPGSEDPSDIAKSFKDLIAKHGLKDLAYSLDINEIIIRIPGKSKIVKFVAK